MLENLKERFTKLSPRQLTVQVPLLTVAILLVALLVTALAAALPLRNYLLSQLDSDLQATLAHGVRSADQLLRDTSSFSGASTTASFSRFFTDAPLADRSALSPLSQTIADHGRGWLSAASFYQDTFSTAEAAPATEVASTPLPAHTAHPETRPARPTHTEAHPAHTVFPEARPAPPLPGGPQPWGSLQIVTLNGNTVSMQVVRDFEVVDLPGGDAGASARALRAQVQAQPDHPVSVSLPQMPNYRLAHIYLVGNAAVPGIPWRVFTDPSQARSFAADTDLDLLQITAGLPLDKVENTVRWQLLQVLLWGGGATVLGGTLVWWLTRRQLAGLGRVAGVAQQVSGALRAGQAPPAVRLSGRDADERSESGQVGQALNTLLDQLGQAWAQRDATEERLRQFVADASHELRTPLAAVRGYSQYLHQFADFSAEAPAASSPTAAPSPAGLGQGPSAEPNITANIHTASGTAGGSSSGETAAPEAWAEAENGATGAANGSAVRLTPQVAVQRILSESERMSGLVEDLLLLARLDSGVKLQRENVDLAQICVENVQDAFAIAPEHQWQLDLPIDPLEDFDEPDDLPVDAPQTGSVSETEHETEQEDQGASSAVDWPEFVPESWRLRGGKLSGAPLELMGDSARLHQLLAVLLTNARKHTPAGTIVTVAARRWEDARGAWALLWVHDNGPGVDPALGQKIFDRFVRADQSRAAQSAPEHSSAEQPSAGHTSAVQTSTVPENPRATGSRGKENTADAHGPRGQSTGLGLSIARAIAQEHGGNVILLPPVIEGAPGQGATFQLSFPLPR